MKFTKYSATGNDFVFFDNRAGTLRLSVAQIQQLAHRRQGIGGDGVILLEYSSVAAAEIYMRYYNGDGSEADMCGNGARATAHFYHTLLGRAVSEQPHTYQLQTRKGLYEVQVRGDFVSLRMLPVVDLPLSSEFDQWAQAKGFSYAQVSLVNSGVDHLVVLMPSTCDLEQLDVYQWGKEIRELPCFAIYGGVNVNFVKIEQTGHLAMRTYERGVEDETLSCGTGTVAVADQMWQRVSGWQGACARIAVQTRGGKLAVVKTEAMEPRTYFFEGEVQAPFSGDVVLRPS